MRLIELGFACNNACRFCAQGELRQVRPSEDDDRVRAAIDAVTSGEVVALVGGEPTMFGALPRWIEQIASRGARLVLVQTNGRRLAYRAYVAELASASRALRLEVSLHGSNAAMHDWHTGVEGSFAQTVAGLRHARAAGVACSITTVVTRASYRHLVEIVRVARALGATAFHPTSAEPLGRAARYPRAEKGSAPPSIVPPPGLAEPHVERALAEARRAGLATWDGRSPTELFAGLGAVESTPPSHAARAPLAAPAE